MSETAFTCPTCGEEHEGLPADYAFGLPDEAFALSYPDLYQRVRSNADRRHHEILEQVGFFK